MRNMKGNNLTIE